LVGLSASLKGQKKLLNFEGRRVQASNSPVPTPSLEGHGVDDLFCHADVQHGVREAGHCDAEASDGRQKGEEGAGHLGLRTGVVGEMIRRRNPEKMVSVTDRSLVWDQELSGV